VVEAEQCRRKLKLKKPIASDDPLLHDAYGDIKLIEGEYWIPEVVDEEIVRYRPLLKTAQEVLDTSLPSILQGSTAEGKSHAEDPLLRVMLLSATKKILWGASGGCTRVSVVLESSATNMWGPAVERNPELLENYYKDVLDSMGRALYRLPELQLGPISLTEYLDKGEMITAEAYEDMMRERQRRYENEDKINQAAATTYIDSDEEEDEEDIEEDTFDLPEPSAPPYDERIQVPIY